ncbi:hypothetical protein BCR35DRAFT_290430 [Leucosporidium creatinivorum]|uniref:DNA polymerase eta n=1 Tax=Leucosporidium creatinivorum TaxID=106004 RepID=A0A1Y2FJM2_9BASI|nr:hypothetical protein BCR35DRAFT_290430 [Leucosporidium creatinivorum]
MAAQAGPSTLHSPSKPSTARVPFSPPKRTTGGSLKGKERALEDSTYPGAITYRHVLGNGNSGAASPLRVISHIDIDAAYASFEMVRLGLDPTVPMAVQQWNGLIAVNYPARAYGITRHEPPSEALKKCPHIVFIHVATYRNGDSEPGYWDDAKPETHKVSLDPYRRESLKILKIFNEHCPIVEKASIDESFLDLTLPVRAKLLARYPYLATLPEGADLDTPLPTPKEMGVTVDWEKVGNLIPINGQKKEVKEVSAEAEEEGEGEGKEEGTSKSAEPVAEEKEVETLEEPHLTWSDVALSIGAEIVATCRNAVHERLGYTCSAGIAPNKMLAKLCSAWKKPNAQTILRHACTPAFLSPMSFQKIRNLGGKLGTQVKEAYGAETVGELKEVELSELQSKLGDDSGTWVWEIIRGLDFSEVEPKTQVKSMLSSKNFRPSISRYSEVCHWINILATELHLRLAEAREQSPGLWPKTITFTHRSPTYVIRSHQTPFPYTSNLSIAYITKFGDKLLRIAIGAGEKLREIKEDSKIGPYSNIQLSFSGLERSEGGQRGIEGFFSAAAAGRANEGAGRVKREGTSEAQGDDVKGKRRKMDDNDDGTPASAINDADDAEITLASTPPPPSRSPTPPLPDLPTYTCPTCRNTLTLPSSAIDSLRPSFDASAAALLLQREKDEHADWHFAREMVEKDRKKSFGGTVKGGAGGKGKSEKGVKGKGGEKAEGKKGKGQQSLMSFFG